MAKKRESVRKTEWFGALERNFERKARDFASQSGFELEVRDHEVFVVRDGRSELLCIADNSRHFWRTTWREMTKQFPALRRYLSRFDG